MKKIQFRAIGKLMKGNDVGERHKLFFTLDDLMRGQPNFAYPEHFDFSEWTGLFDKNGKEVYEGDIMKVLDRDWVDAEKDTNIYIVYWYKGGFMLVNKVGIEEKEKDIPNTYNKDWLETSLYKGYGRDKFEIIGNIYENPELITNNK